MPSLNLRYLKLQNYRCFEEIEIDFHAELTVLVASNGGGKTSVLDAIAVAFGSFLGAFSEAKGSGMEGSDIRLLRTRNTNSNEMEYANGGAVIEAHGYIPPSTRVLNGEFSGFSAEANVKWRRALTEPRKARTTIKDAKVLTDFGKRLQAAVRTPGIDVQLPVLAYYGTGRLWQQKKQSQAKLPKTRNSKNTSRTVGYTDCMDPASKYKIFIAWFEYWSRNAALGKLKSAELGKALMQTEFDDYVASVSGAVNACLKPSGWGGITFSHSYNAVVAEHPVHGQLPVELLSDGIRNMIGLVADIAFRATKLNPQLGAYAAAQTGGLVLIDELDMHLHPEWQQVVLHGLKSAFPKMQWIVTTHSPQILSTVKRDCIRHLGADENGRIVATKPFARTYGQSSQLVMHQVMQVDPLPPIEERDELLELTRLVDQGVFSKKDELAKKRATYLLEHLRKRLGDTHEQLMRIDRTILRHAAMATVAAQIRAKGKDPLL